MEKYYRKQITVGDTQVNAFDRLKNSQLLAILQEAAGEHGALLGVDKDSLLKKKLFWALIRYHIEITRLPRSGEIITVETWPMPTTRTAYPRATVAYDADGNELQLGDILGTGDDMIQSKLEEAVDITVLRRSLTLLSPRERELIAMRYGLEGRREQTQKEAAAVLGISQSYISRLEKKILLRLKKEFIRQTSCA